MCGSEGHDDLLGDWMPERKGMNRYDAGHSSPVPLRTAMI
jgi:hypothetical protein